MATAKKKQEQAEDMESDLEDLDGQDSYEDGQLDQNGVNMCWKLSPTLKLNSAKQKQNALFCAFVYASILASWLLITSSMT